MTQDMLLVQWIIDNVIILHQAKQNIWCTSTAAFHLLSELIQPIILFYSQTLHNFTCTDANALQINEPSKQYKQRLKDEPLRTDLHEDSATSNGVLPSVFLIPGSAPCWSKTERQIILPIDILVQSS